MFLPARGVVEYLGAKEEIAMGTYEYFSRH
jgi:hypothetical protein